MSIQTIQIEGRRITVDVPPFVIAEISTNHNGKPDTAKQIVAEANKASTDAGLILLAETKAPTEPNTRLRFCFCLSFSEILDQQFRSHFDHVLIVHESDLPKGKGWSPLTWQILEGQNRIPVTLLEAADNVDSGLIYKQRWIEFEGHELIDELRAGQAEATHYLCRWFVDHYPASAQGGTPQQGEESFYARRRPDDSQLDPRKNLAEQFDLLRVVDNQRYPAFFDYHGQQYQLRITKH